MRTPASMVAVPPPANPLDDPDDLDALRQYADDLVSAIEVALPAWVRRTIATRWEQWQGGELPVEVAEAARDAAGAAVDAVLPPLRALLAEDVGDQEGNPLAVVRRAAAYPTQVLAAAGMPAVERDADAERLFPDDAYDIMPAAFSDLGAEVHEPGLRWGAAKAHVLLRRRRGEPPSG